MAVLDINQDAAAASAQRIGGIGIACDVADAASAEAAVAKAREAHGPARLLVNCAGVGTAGRIVGRDGPMQLAAFEQVIRINLIGSFNLLRLAAVLMTPPAAMSPLVWAWVRIRGVVATFSTRCASVVPSRSVERCSIEWRPHINRGQQHQHRQSDVGRQQDVHERRPGNGTKITKTPAIRLTGRINSCKRASGNAVRDAATEAIRFPGQKKETKKKA